MTVTASAAILWLSSLDREDQWNIVGPFEDREGRQPKDRPHHSVLVPDWIVEVFYALQFPTSSPAVVLTAAILAWSALPAADRKSWLNEARRPPAGEAAFSH